MTTWIKFESCDWPVGQIATGCDWPVLSSCSFTAISAFSRRMSGKLRLQSSPKRALWSRCSICRNFSFAVWTLWRRYWNWYIYIYYISVMKYRHQHQLWYQHVPKTATATSATALRILQAFRSWSQHTNHIKMLDEHWQQGMAVVQLEANGSDC